jgi:predicted ATP-dependent serine protease
MGDRHRDENASTSLRGRRSETAALDGLLDRVRTGRSAVLVLRGEPGIGKTALLRYVTDRAAGFSVARWMGVESEIEFGFHRAARPLHARAVGPRSVDRTPA